MCLPQSSSAERFLRAVKEMSPDIVGHARSRLPGGKSSWNSLEDRYPHTLKCALDNLLWHACVFTPPCTTGRIEFLVEVNVPPCTRVEPASGDCHSRCHFLHPRRPAQPKMKSPPSANAEPDQVAKSLQDYKKPVLVTGDLNDVAWSG